MLNPWCKSGLLFDSFMFYNIGMKNTLNDELAVCGFAAVKTLEKRNWQKIQRLYFTEQRAPLFGGLCKKLSAEKRPYNVVEPEELEKLCGSVHHQGVVAMVDMPEILPLNTDITERWVEQKEDAILLDRVGNANNLGAIVRSAAFFGVKNIVIPLDEAQSSITTSSYRVAEGGMEFVNVYSIKSIPKLLAAMEGRMLRLGTALDAKERVGSIKRMDRDMPVLAVLGNEENGISKAVRENVDHLVLIPFGAESRECSVESLNVAQASAVLMYEMAGRRLGENDRPEPKNSETRRESGHDGRRSESRFDERRRDSRPDDRRPDPRDYRRPDWGREENRPDPRDYRRAGPRSGERRYSRDRDFERGPRRRGGDYED